MSNEATEVKSVKIKKAKIISGLFLDVEWTEELPGHSKNEVGLKYTVSALRQAARRVPD